MEIDGCSNAPVCDDDSLLEFRGFDADDGDTSQIRLQSIGGHMFVGSYRHNLFNTNYTVHLHLKTVDSKATGSDYYF